jgi:c-di-GMP phosphodiesterase
VEFPLPAPQGRLGLEILEDIPVDDRLVAAVRELSARGYTIALDDFIFHESLAALVDAADIVKIDVAAMSAADITEHVRLLRREGLALLAEKVETREVFEFCRELGFDYFQGYFLCRPNIVRGLRMPASRASILHLLATLQSPETTSQDLERIISQDVSLSFKLLRYINSLYFALPRRIDSIHQAVVYLGTEAIRTWVMLFALSGIDDKPHELVTTALVRARMCELVGDALGDPDRASLFTVGLFSTLDAMMDRPMRVVLQALPLSQEARAALLRHEGRTGAVLACVLAYERADWAGIEGLGLESTRIRDAYLQSVAWATELESQIEPP